MLRPPRPSTIDRPNVSWDAAWGNLATRHAIFSGKKIQMRGNRALMLLTKAGSERRAEMKKAQAAAASVPLRVASSRLRLRACCSLDRRVAVCIVANVY